MNDLTGFQRDLLYVIGGLEDPHGLSLKDELEDYYSGALHHRRLYPNLDTLVDEVLVEKGQLDRRTNVYSLTDRGQRETHAHSQGLNRTLLVPEAVISQTVFRGGE